MTSANAQRPNSMALSVDVEDWFQTENMKCVIPRDTWDKCELRVERNTMRMLEILYAQNKHATFFVLGWIAERCPELVRAISAEGHEVASHGYAHELVYSLAPNEFRADIVRSKKLLEDLTGKPVCGYRAPCFSITEWAITILQEEGFVYDSSMVPTLAHDRYGRLDGIDIGKPIVMIREGFYEVCVSCLPLGKRGIPWGGGGYFRFIPYALWLRGVHRILNSGLPYVFYIHPWEIDAGQPRVRGVKAAHEFRQRINLNQCEERFENLVSAFDWTSICKLLEAWRASQTLKLDELAADAVIANIHSAPVFARGIAAVPSEMRPSRTTDTTLLHAGEVIRRALP